MKIICVCGLGMGSSLILKMSVDKAMMELGIECDIEHQSAGMVEGLKPDIIVASRDFQEEFADRDNVVYIDNIVKSDEVKAKMKEYLTKKGLM